ncbi:MAG: BlaI/MecI/CopY family transcriptional regulator [Planctomycetota bacterium]
MARQENRQPTNAELEILLVLWDKGPCTVREVYKSIAAKREAGYTTILKLMQIMTEKGLLLCDKNVRPQLYKVVQSQQKTQRQLIGDLLDRAFSGSPGNLVLQALSTKKATQEERRKIRELLDQLEGEKK